MTFVHFLSPASLKYAPVWACWNRAPPTVGLATDRLDPAGVYFGTTNGEIWGSADAGRSWSLIAQHLPPILSVETATL